MSLSVSSTVLVRVDRLYPQKAEVTVVSIHNNTNITTCVINNPIRGSIRIQDVRSFDIDKATIADHFGPGDIVRATTLSTGDAKSCFFSTIGPELGVVLSKGEGDNFLLPVDQSHMRDEKSGRIYRKKVAKPEWMMSPPIVE